MTTSILTTVVDELNELNDLRILTALELFRQNSIPYSKVNNQIISFPSSAVLYLTSNTPDYHLIFPNGQQIRYHLPIYNQCL